MFVLTGRIESLNTVISFQYLCYNNISSSKNNPIEYRLVKKGEQSHKHHLNKKRGHTHVAQIKC